MRSDGRSISLARLRGLTSVVAALAGAALAAPAAAQELEYTGALQGATGDYLFTQRTTSLALLNGLAYTFGRLRVAATLPVVYQNSSAVTYIGGIPVPTGGPDAGAVRQREPGRRVPMGPGRRGSAGPGATPRAVVAAAEEPAALTVTEPGSYHVEIGDPVLQLGVELAGGFGLVRTFSIHTLVKVPVAGIESGVGTGEWDYGAGIALGLGEGRTFVLADASYWVVGDLPDLRLRNTLTYSVSVGRSLGVGRWSVLGSVTGATSIVDRADAPLAVGVGVGYAPERSYGLVGGVSAGLSETSPDLSSYLGWRFVLGGSR